MAYAPRVRWDITAASDADAVVVTSSMDVAVAGAPVAEVLAANARVGAVVKGDYHLANQAGADTLYAAAKAQLVGLLAINGMTEGQLCDHNAAGQATEGGCIAQVQDER